MSVNRDESILTHIVMSDAYVIYFEPVLGVLRLDIS